MWRAGKFNSETFISLCSILAPTIIGLVYFSLNYDVLLADRIHNMDRTLIELSVEQARTFDIFSGAFSRFGFRHPGPFYYYYLSFGDYFFSWINNPTASYRLLTLIFNIIILTYSIILIEKYFKRGAGLLLLLSFLISTWSTNRFYILDYWNPNLIPSVATLFIISSALLLAGKLNFMPLYILAGSIITQLHISGLPFVGFISGTLLIILVHQYLLRKEAISTPLTFNYILLAVFILVILWLPVIFDLVFFKGGNPARIFNFLSNTKGGYDIPAAFKFIISFFNGPLTLHGHLPPMVAFAITTLFPLIFWRQLPARVRNLSIIYLLALIISLFAATQIEGALHRYLLSTYYSVMTIGVFITLVGGFCVLEKFTPLHIPISILVLSILVTVLIWPAPLTPRPRSDKVKEEAIRFINALNPKANTLYRVTFGDPAPYKFASSIILELTKKGIKTCVEPKWGYFFGDGLRCEYNEYFHPKLKLAKLHFDFAAATETPIHTPNFYHERKHSIRWGEPDV